MVNIKPFKGIRYSKDKISDFNLVITPPYDVISDEELDNYRKSEFNFSHLILPKGGGEKYKEAAEKIKTWIADNVLVQDKEDSIYIYVQRYNLNGEQKERMGFISLLEIEEIGEGILDHEKTMAKPIEDRYKMMESTFSDLGQVFVMYDDRDSVIDEFLEKKKKEKLPDIEFTDNLGIAHKLWRVSDNDVIDKIRQEMKKYQVIIADGHHRNKTRRIFRDKHQDIEGARYSLCTFVNSFHGGMIILPTNRIVKGLEHADKGEVIKKLENYFQIDRVNDEKELISSLENTKVMIDKSKNLKNHVMGMYCSCDNSSYLLRLKDPDILEKDFKDKSDIYRKLDVNILHNLIFDKVLGISEKDQEMVKVEFVKGNEETLKQVKDNPECQFGFFLKPPLMREVFLTARNDELMPQKSTFFYPKVYSGLVIYKMEED